MQLYIMRHGEAQSFADYSSVNDSERKLTQQGIFEAQLMADWLTKMKVDVSHLWVSPFIRAQQTCAVISKNLAVNPEILDFITPQGDAKQVHDFIDGFILEQLGKMNVNDGDKEPQGLFLVSHMPLVSYLVAELTSYQAAPIFATAAIAEINYDIKSMKGELVRLITPLDLCE